MQAYAGCLTITQMDSNASLTSSTPSNDNSDIQLIVHLLLPSRMVDGLFLVVYKKSNRTLT